MKMVACAGSQSSLSASRARVLFGLIVMLVGLVLLAGRLEWWGLRVNVPLWPWVLLLLGVARLSDRPEGAQSISRSGLWFIAVGMWGLVTEYRLLGIGYGRTWPLLVVIAGGFVIWRALDPRRIECAGKGGRA